MLFSLNHYKITSVIPVIVTVKITIKKGQSVPSLYGFNGAELSDLTRKRCYGDCREFLFVLDLMEFSTYLVLHS